MKSKHCARPEEKVQAMLDALADDIHHRPEILLPVPVRLVDRIRSLVGDVEIDLDLDQPLPPETEGAGAR